MRVTAVAVGLGGLALTVPTLAASNGKAEKEAPAAQAAKCCEVAVAVDRRIVTAGGAPAALTVATNGSANGCTVTSRALAIRLDGLRADQVRVERLIAGVPVTLAEDAPSGGQVVATDVLADGKLICGTTETTGQYRVTFTDDAPNGAVLFEATAATAAGKPLGSGTATATVVGAVVLPPAALPPARVSPTTPPPPPAADDEAPTTPPPSDPSTSDPSTSDSAPSDPADSAPGADPSGYAESEGPAGAGNAEPPAMSQRGQTSSGLSAALIAGGLGSMAVVLALFGAFGWRLRRRTDATWNTDEDTQPLPPPAAAHP
ncbi:hypothetical protein WEI85_44910 [Actinomycetes bacterium KLBMP 9797]